MAEYSCQYTTNRYRIRSAGQDCICQSIQDGISVLDAELIVVRVNQAMENWYAHMFPLEGKKCHEVYHGRSKPCSACPTIRALNTGKLEMSEVPLEGL